MRIVRLITTPLILLALLGLLLWGAFWGWQNLTAPLPEPEPTPCVTVSTELIAVTDVSVRIYNAGFTSGLANRVSTRLQDVGFNVVQVSNTEERVTKGVLIRTNEGNQPGIRLVTSYFKEFELEFDDRVDGTVDILLASEEPIPGDTPLYRVSSGDGGTTCVPPEVLASAEAEASAAAEAPAEPAAPAEPVVPAEPAVPAVTAEA